ncbi:hypothetical protein ATANTOWER_006738 [Ataeniobius toweri]|uniref:Uncharacterized protein n=1 Tax=Ataeniobius toweri TaxID=208326 RepID=A0ABU7AN55_9TELE|nr:hypothetical protein [Ataeniobius toweri]
MEKVAFFKLDEVSHSRLCTHPSVDHRLHSTPICPGFCSQFLRAEFPGATTRVKYNWCCFHPKAKTEKRNKTAALA